MDFLEGKNVLVFDLETTGFPAKIPKKMGKEEYYPPSELKAYQTARIVQIAWSFIENFSRDKIDPEEITSIIRKPKDFGSIPTSKIHGITFAQARAEGKNLSKILNDEGFGWVIMNAEVLVAHNCLFDLHILASECFRLGFTGYVEKLKGILDSSSYFCTGEVGRAVCKVPCFSPFHTFKMPRLGELYKFMYGKEPEEVHKAEADVKTLLLILLKL